MFGKDQGGYEYGYGTDDDYLLLPPPPPPQIPPSAASSFTGPRGLSLHRFPGSHGHTPYPRHSTHTQLEVRQPPVPGEDYYQQSLAPPPPPLPPLETPPPPPPPPDLRPSAAPQVTSYEYPPPQRQGKLAHNSVTFPPPTSYGGFYAPRPPRTSYGNIPQTFSTRYPRPGPIHPPFLEESVRVRRTFVQDSFTPSIYDDDPAYWNSKETVTKPDNTPPENLPHGDPAGVHASDIAHAPLRPPPMPPMFSWQNSNIRPPESITELRVSDPNLAFIPIPAEKIDLIQMTQAMIKEKEASTDSRNTATINSLKQQGFITASWPKELLDMFQPLYCKLCTLTLSSSIVAADHYKGKKHKKGIDKWLHDYRQRQPKAAPYRPVNKFRNLRPTGMASAKIISPPSGMPNSISTDTHTQAQTSPSLPPISGSNAIPLGDPGGEWLNTSNFQESGSSKRFPLGRPPPKKPKSDPNAGPNFGFCNLCQVALTSQQHYDQHHAGKNHQRKVQQYAQRRSRYNLQTHEPYSAPTRPLIRPGLNISFPSYF